MGNMMGNTATKPGHFLEPIENPKQGDCRCCKKSVSGNLAYKCPNCEFFIHKSCLELTEKTEMEFKHESGERHHFFETKITMVKLHDNDENEVVCSMCKEIVLHLSGKNAPNIYSCFIPNCNYIHKSCAEAPEDMEASHLHDHKLYLKPPTQIQHCCDACGKNFGASFFYECKKCEYEIDIKCSFRRKVSPDECNPHTFILIGSQIEFTCQVCGEKRSDMGFVCSNCQFLIHTKCARFPRLIKVWGHDHCLTIIPPPSQPKSQGSHMCQVCQENMNKDHGAYCCEQACGFIAHLWCAYFEQDQSEIISTSSYRKLLVEEEKKEHTPQKKRVSNLHGHELILMEEQPKGKSCAVCMRPIFLPQFYSCGECPFFAHIKCVQVPTEIDQPEVDRHRLTLHTPSIGFFCRECDCSPNGFFYACDECRGDKLDIQCALIPDSINHKLHKHRLFRGGFLLEPECNACGEDPWWARRFKCKTCDFCICIRCVTLPLVATHKYDKHLLRLTNEPEQNPKECYCQICEEKLCINYWFYYCKDCDFIGHPKCVLLNQGQLVGTFM